MNRFSVDYAANRINKFDEQWYQIADPKTSELIDCRSVTTILDVYPKGIGFKLWLQRAGEDADKIRNEAGQLGSNVHRLIELTLRGETITFEGLDGQRYATIDEWERYLSWCRWYKEAIEKQSIEPIAIEQIVFDLENRIAGTIDLVANTKDGVKIFDWKTGGYIGDTAEIQVNQYRKMVNATDEFVTGCEIIQLNPSVNKKGYKIIVPEGYEADVRAFASCVQIFDRAYPNAKPKYKTYPNEVSLEYLNNNKLNLGE